MSKTVFDYFEAGGIVKTLSPLLEKKQAYIRLPDYKIIIRNFIPYNSPWIHTVGCGKRNCGLYLNVFHDFFGIIHSNCLNCWKVVARPKTLEDVFEILEFQKFAKLSIPSKVGIETRNYVDALYGAYWYCDSKEEGIALKNKLRSLLNEEGVLKEGAEVYLKRACTEYEMKLGDSISWGAKEHQEEVEQALEGIIELEEQEYISATPPAYMEEAVKTRWVEWAYEHGDLTYLNFTGGKELSSKTNFPKIRKY